jgi:hypothetical protein
MSAIITLINLAGNYCLISERVRRWHKGMPPIKGHPLAISSDYLFLYLKKFKKNFNFLIF